MKTYRIIWVDRVGSSHHGEVEAMNRMNAWFGGMVKYPTAWDVTYIVEVK